MLYIVNLIRLCYLYSMFDKYHRTDLTLSRHSSSTVSFVSPYNADLFAYGRSCFLQMKRVRGQQDDYIEKTKSFTRKKKKCKKVQCLHKLYKKFCCMKILVRTGVKVHLLSKLEEREHLKYFGNIYCYGQSHGKSGHVSKPQT